MLLSSYYFTLIDKLLLCSIFCHSIFTLIITQKASLNSYLFETQAEMSERLRYHEAKAMKKIAVGTYPLKL